jgi:hypothetical protein
MIPRYVDGEPAAALREALEEDLDALVGREEPALAEDSATVMSAA